MSSSALYDICCWSPVRYNRSNWWIYDWRTLMIYRTRDCFDISRMLSSAFDITIYGCMSFTTKHCSELPLWGAPLKWGYWWLGSNSGPYTYLSLSPIHIIIWKWFCILRGGWSLLSFFSLSPPTWYEVLMENFLPWANYWPKLRNPNNI